jgi:hypothetical protein
MRHGPIRVRAKLAALACALSVSAVLAAPASADPRPAPRCNGAKQLCQRPFDRVVLGGAHNAMSAFDLGWKLPNQTLAIPDQLRAGIRALLIDTHYGRLQADGTVRTDDDGAVTTGERGLYLCHALCELGASPLAPVLSSIRRFLRRRPFNVLAIVNEDHIAPADFAAAVKQSGLIRHIYRGPPGPSWPTLRRMIAVRQQVVVLAERDDGDLPWYHTAYDGILQETPYSFQTPDLLIDPANWAASCRPNRGGTTGSLFLVNHWSPSTAPPEPDPAASAAVNAADVILGRARECERLRGRLPSIIAADQVTYGGLLAAIRTLNGVRP